MKRFGLTALLSLFLLGVGYPLWAKVVYVSPNGNDLNNGLSWATAKRTVTGALQIALPNDQIWVRYGVYVERITLKNGVSLYGGFRGNETSLSQRPPFPRPSPDPYETVLDGNQQGSVVTSPDTANRPYRIDGFTIRNGKAENGGGLYLTASASYLTVANCFITQNTASGGGAVYCNSSLPSFVYCVISGNSVHGIHIDGSSAATLTGCVISANSGSGIYCAQSPPTLTNCTLSANGGHGMHCVAASPTLTGCIISNNTGSGVLCEYSSRPTLTNCLISENLGAVKWLDAGVACSESSSPTLAKCVISDNRRAGVYCIWSSSPRFTGCAILKNRGGIGCTRRSSPSLTDCIIVHNDIVGIYCEIESPPTLIRCTIAANNGNGVSCYWYSPPTLLGCNVSGNLATNGGGILCTAASSPVLRGCTVVYNAAGDGGGIWTDSGVYVTNTIIAHNAGGGIRAPVPNEFRSNCVWGNIPYNFAGDIGNPTGTNGNISVDPLLVAGHLLPGSPCINRGDNSAVTVDTDIDGEARIAGSTVDIGADEFHAPILHGYLLFNDFGGSLPPIVDWEIRAGSAEVRPLLIDIDGAFVVPRVPSGQFELSVKPLSYLRRTVEVDTRRGSVLNMVISLTNGDIDGDNEVTLFDFGRLVAAFGSSPGGRAWDPRADLDGDNEVTLFDFGVLVRNFGEMGDN